MTMTGAAIDKTLSDIFYEDPEPVEDGMQQELTITFLAFVLRWWFRQRPDVFVSAGGFIFWDPANGNERVGPDCYMALDTDPDFVYQFPNYFVWEVGKPPDFVMEVASPSTASNDLGRKHDLYARLGITEYWKLDPTGGELYGAALMGERLVDGEYVAYDLNVEPDGSAWSRSEVLELDFLWDGERFDIRDPLTGRTIDPRVEAETAHERARTAERQIESERQARLDLEQENRKLREENRRLRRRQGEDE